MAISGVQSHREGEEVSPLQATLNKYSVLNNLPNEMKKGFRVPVFDKAVRLLSDANIEGNQAILRAGAPVSDELLIATNALVRAANSAQAAEFTNGGGVKLANDSDGQPTKMTFDAKYLEAAKSIKPAGQSQGAQRG